MGFCDRPIHVIFSDFDINNYYQTGGLMLPKEYSEFHQAIKRKIPLKRIITDPSGKWQSALMQVSTGLYLR